MPYCPVYCENQVHFFPFSADDKVVADYANISIPEVAKLPYDDYLLFRRDGYITNWQKTEWGREYLEECWISQQTKPDRAALRKRFSKSKEG